MEKVLLAAKSRASSGTGGARRLRREGLVPAVLYGHGMTPVSLQVDYKDFFRVLHTKAGENSVVDLNVEDVKLKESTCLIKDIQQHPVTDEILHVDFTVISMNEEIEVGVVITAINVEESIGIKDGGVLDLVHHEVEVSCLPTNIPEKIEIDVKDLEIGHSIHVKEVTFPEGVKCLLDSEEALVAIVPPAKEEEEPAEEADASAEPEVIEKGKKEEGAPAEGGGGEAKSDGGGEDKKE